MNEQGGERGPQDGTRVNLDEELRYWTHRFGVTADRLQAAVAKVGTDVDAVAREING